MIEIDCPCGENHKYTKDIYLTTEDCQETTLVCGNCGDKVVLKTSFTVIVLGVKP